MNMDYTYMNYSQSNMLSSDTSEQKNENKPFQEIIDYFEMHKSSFSYKDLLVLVRYIYDDVSVTLSDGTVVDIGKEDNIIKLVMKNADGTSFVGCYGNKQDLKDFIDKMLG